MKRFSLIVASLMLLVIVAASAASQVRPTASPSPARPSPPRPVPANAPLPDTKIALVDTSVFGDEKAGITKYVNAVKSLQREFQPRQTELNGIQGRIKTLADEIGKLSGASVVDPKTIQAKQDEAERLQRDLKYKKEQADADFNKRYQEVVTPISNDVGRALDQFAVQKGITMILDPSKMMPALLTVNPAMDVTQAFIAEYNSKNP